MSRSSGFSGVGRGAVLALVALLGAGLLAAPPAAAQDGTLILLADDTLKETRRAIFSGLANQVGTLPNPTGGGFVFRFDPTLGVFDEVVAKFALAAGSLGNVRTTTLKAFTEAEFRKIVAALP